MGPQSKQYTKKSLLFSYQQSTFSLETKDYAKVSPHTNGFFIEWVFFLLPVIGFSLPPSVYVANGCAKYATITIRKRVILVPKMRNVLKTKFLRSLP